MNIFLNIERVLIDIAQSLFSHEEGYANIDFDRVTVEIPKDKAHGDFASNIAMMMAKPLGQSPRKIAENIAEKLSDNAVIAEVTVAGPGFLNLKVKNTAWHEVLEAILVNPSEYGRAKIGADKRVNVEFVSANPTGPLHVGHMRGAVVGDALARLLAYAGFDVTKEYYINDGGAQVDVLARSAYQRYLEANGHNAEFPDGTYPGEYLISVGRALQEKFGDEFIGKPEEIWLDIFREFSIDAMLELIKKDLRDLGVEMDVFYSEKSLYQTGKIEAALEMLDKAGCIYKGTLPPPKGKTPDDWEPREQILFKSTDFGDDVDRAIQKSDGGWTYFAPDIAYHFDKIERGFDELIDVFGADHGGYVKRMKAAVKALSHNSVPLDIELCQLVKLYKNGEPFKMSKRAGNFVLLSDVIEEVGANVARFVMLMRKSDAPLDFDFEKVKELSKDNPVFYVQYAHARARSAIDRAEASFQDKLHSKLDLSLLTSEDELTLISKLASFPKTIEAAALAREPHRIAFYLYELAGLYHAWQHLGKVDPSMRFVLDEDMETTKARIALVKAAKAIIANGLRILGVEPLDEMSFDA